MCSPGPCGSNARCQVNDGREECYCDIRHTGDPYAGCTRIPDVPADPCSPSPCGKNTQCRVEGSEVLCACLPGYEGDPLVPAGCRPECERDRDCPNHLACINLKCVDNCPGSCGIGAECLVQNHRPYCRCPAGAAFGANPLVDCTVQRPPPRPVEVEPQCSVNEQCKKNEICRNGKCVDPCPGLCGVNAVCTVNEYHRVRCQCREGFNGDPYTLCRRKYKKA